MKRRSVSPFSLSFLDVMFCGFGAVVLLVLILNTDTVRARNELSSDLRGEVLRLEKELLVGGADLADARGRLETADRDLLLTQEASDEVSLAIEEIERTIAFLSRETRERRGQVERAGADLRQLDREHDRLAEQAAAAPEPGDNVHRFVGDGDRQYLTGLKVGGRRILILLDASASMLDETLVNVIRRRNMDAERRRSAPKWQRARATVEWLISNLPVDARFQVYLFNTQARAAVPESAGAWLQASKRGDLSASLRGLAQAAPGGGDQPLPGIRRGGPVDSQAGQILLVTDGLPTQGSSKPSGTTVSAEKRLSHFERALRKLPSGIPVNTILLPMEGDAYAAAAYWKLALDTKGSFITPARDWP